MSADHNVVKGHFTHGPSAVTMTLWEPKRKYPKAAPRHLQNLVVWSRIVKCSVKSYVTGPLTKCWFNEFLNMRVLTYDKTKWNQRLWAFGVPCSPGLVLGLPPRGGFWKQSKWPWNMIHLVPCRIPCRLLHPSCIHVLCWSLKHSVKRTWTNSTFSTNESPWSVMVTGSQSRVWSGPKLLDHLLVTLCKGIIWSRARNKHKFTQH